MENTLTKVACSEDLYHIKFQDPTLCGTGNFHLRCYHDYHIGITDSRKSKHTKFGQLLRDVMFKPCFTQFCQLLKVMRGTDI